MIRPVIAIGMIGWAIQPAAAQRVKAAPYIEASQVLVGDLKSGDMLTYSQVGAGIDASVDTRRVQVQVSYQYQHNFAWDRKQTDGDLHNGLARVRAAVAPGVTLEASAIAAQTRADIRGAAVQNFIGEPRNASQVYSFNAGPKLATHIGAVSVNGAYRFGYTKTQAPNGTGVPAGQPRLDYYDASTVHVATASAGVKPGMVLPVGLTASGSFTREETGQLDQRFENKWGRGDIVVPLVRGLALSLGLGYETIQSDQRAALRDAKGRPVLDRKGRFITDPASPRRIAYDFDGLFWDAGVIWRPSSRTNLEARVGRRYGAMRYTADFTHQIDGSGSIQFSVYDNVESFGQQLGGSLASLPTSFAAPPNPFGNMFGGCIYATNGAATSACMNAVLASAVTNVYHARGVSGIATFGRGGTRIGFGGGYLRRAFLAPPGMLLHGVADENLYGQFFASTPVGLRGSWTANLLATWSDSGIPGSASTFGWNANTAYTHRFGHLSATASAGLFSYNREGPDTTSAQALLGLRYGF